MLFGTLLGLAAAVEMASAAKLEKIANFGANPSKITMFLYAPDKVATKPAIIVAVRTRFQDASSTLSPS